MNIVREKSIPGNVDSPSGKRDGLNSVLFQSNGVSNTQVLRSEQMESGENCDDKLDWVCPVCRAKFARKWTMERHMGRKVCKERVQTQVDNASKDREDIFYMDQTNANLRNRLADMSDRLPDESIAAWKKRKFFPPKRKVETPDSATHQIVSVIAPNAMDPERSELGALMETVNSIQETLKTLTEGGALVKKAEDDNNGQKSTESKGEDGDENKDGTKEPKIDIVCLAKGDYIKKLIQLHDGDEEKAMNYIKNIGIATDFLEGDFRLIKKVYFDGKKKSQFPIRIKDFKRNKLEYLEENGEWILDIRGEIVGKRLCENIVSTLLIANTQFNEVIIAEKDEDRKELLLDLFQINKTQAHIMKLLERKTQGKLSRRVAEFINFCTEVHAETGSLDNVKKAYD